MTDTIALAFPPASARLSSPAGSSAAPPLWAIATSPVDHDRLAVDAARLVAREVDDGRGDLLGRDEPLLRTLRLEQVARLLGRAARRLRDGLDAAARHLGVDEPGAHAVHGDALRR